MLPTTYAVKWWNYVYIVARFLCHSSRKIFWLFTVLPVQLPICLQSSQPPWVVMIWGVGGAHLHTSFKLKKMEKFVIFIYPVFSIWVLRLSHFCTGNKSECRLWKQKLLWSCMERVGVGNNMLASRTASRALLWISLYLKLSLLDLWLTLISMASDRKKKKKKWCLLPLTYSVCQYKQICLATWKQ